MRKPWSAPAAGSASVPGELPDSPARYTASSAESPGRRRASSGRAGGCERSRRSSPRPTGDRRRTTAPRGPGRPTPTGWSCGGESWSDHGETWVVVRVIPDFRCLSKGNAGPGRVSWRAYPRTRHPTRGAPHAISPRRDPDSTRLAGRRCSGHPWTGPRHLQARRRAAASPRRARGRRQAAPRALDRAGRRPAGRLGEGLRLPRPRRQGRRPRPRRSTASARCRSCSPTSPSCSSSRRASSTSTPRSRSTCPTSSRPTRSSTSRSRCGMLMAHRSGLVREPPVGNYFDPTDPTLAETVASLNGTDAGLRRRATRIKYSNAAIARRRLRRWRRRRGEPFATYLQRARARPARDEVERASSRRRRRRRTSPTR